MKKIIFATALIFLIFDFATIAQQPYALSRSTPEAEGVSSAAITAFLDSVNAGKHEFHSFMLIRHGKVVAEGWWSPYRPDLRHTLYSLSKSFTATAIGFAKSEGKLKLDDKVISFFPDAVPDSASDFLRQLTVKDLLTMSVGQDPDPTGIVVQDSAWVNRFFRVPIRFTPSSRFLYNSAATYMLSAIVQKVTGQKTLDYLQPRLFDPLHISKPDWEESPQHVNTGGWGLRLKTEDIAKFAQLFLQNGIWNGKQILPKGWVEEASSAHIIQHPNYSQAKRDSSDWEQGYGYQMWRCRNNAFRGDGAFGQYAIVMPDQDAVIAITSETGDMQGELDLIWKILLPAMHSGRLPANNNEQRLLKNKLQGLQLPVKKESIASSKAPATKYKIDANTQNIQSISFDLKKQVYVVTIGNDAGEYPIQFAPNSWQQGDTKRKGPYLVSAAINNFEGLPTFKVAGEYTWIDANTLELVLRYIESPHTETLVCHFDGKNISVDVKQSFKANGPTAVITLKGAAE